jgi:hypothetical protein
MSRADLRETALTLAGLLAVAFIFLPFAEDYVPISFLLPRRPLLEPDWRGVLPCVLLPLPISVGLIVLQLRGRLPRWADLAGWILATLSALSFWLAIEPDLSLDSDQLGLAALVLSYASAVWLCFRGIDGTSGVRGIAMMQCVWAITMVFWLVAAAYWEVDLAIGGWLALAALLAYLLQLGFAAQRLSAVLAFIVSLTLVASAIYFLTDL